MPARRLRSMQNIVHCECLPLATPSAAEDWACTRTLNPAAHVRGVRFCTGVAMGVGGGLQRNLGNYA